MTKVIETHYIFMKIPKKMSDMLKDTQNSPSPLFHVVSSLEKLFQAAVARNGRANLQPTLNKGGGGASFTILVTGCLQN